MRIKLKKDTSSNYYSVDSFSSMEVEVECEYTEITHAIEVLRKLKEEMKDGY